MNFNFIDTVILDLIKLACKWFSLASTLAVLYGCEGSGSGGEQTVFDSSVNLTGATLWVNNVTGSDAADGINMPYQTLQHALNQLRPGDVLVIEDTGQPYRTNAIIAEEHDIDGNLVRTLRGYKLATSGTQSAPIVIEGRGLGLAEINQMQTGSTSADATVGLFLDCVSHIVIRNLEIYNANEAGITTSTDGACDTTNIIIEGNHIHHIYGEKYVGGIRIMDVSDVLIRDNYIHDIFSNASIEDKPLIKNGQGIHNIVVESNRLESLDVGIAINAQGLGNSAFSLGVEEAASAIQIKNNVFNSVNDALSFTTHISDASTVDEQKTGSFTYVDIVGNVFEKIDSAALVSAGDSQHQSHDVCIYNNTIINASASALDISGVSGLELFNNIFVMPQKEILLTRASDNTSLINSIAYSDYNLFYNFLTLMWKLDVNGPNEVVYSDLTNWQLATHPQMMVSPDLSAMIDDPQFNGADYTLYQNSLAIGAGRFGLSIGVDFSLPAPVNTLGFPCADREPK